MDFERAVSIVLELEAGFVFDSNDPGGATKYGISQRSYPDANIKELTIAHAKAIYKYDYWEAMKCDLLPSAIRLMVFDCAVNQGVGTSAKLLQRAVGAQVDGFVGTRTVAAAMSAPCMPELLEALAKLRMLRYQDLATWHNFGKGWANRLLLITCKSYQE